MEGLATLSWDGKVVFLQKTFLLRCFAVFLAAKHALIWTLHWKLSHHPKRMFNPEGAIMADVTLNFTENESPSFRSAKSRAASER